MSTAFNYLFTSPPKNTIDEGNVAQYLQEAPVPYITRDECRQTAYGHGGIESKMICAGYPDMGGIDACQVRI